MRRIGNVGKANIIESTADPSVRLQLQHRREVLQADGRAAGPQVLGHPHLQFELAGRSTGRLAHSSAVAISRRLGRVLQRADQQEVEFRDPFSGGGPRRRDRLVRPQIEGSESVEVRLGRRRAVLFQRHFQRIFKAQKVGRR